MNKLLRSRKGQGTTEYIVIIAIAVLFAVGVFWRVLQPKLATKVSAIGSAIDSAH
jgi:hypothetical protein